MNADDFAASKTAANAEYEALAAHADSQFYFPWWGYLLILLFIIILIVAIVLIVIYTRPST